MISDTINFSIILPTYNRAKIVGKAIDSIIDQSYSNYELIIVDDGSTDNTQDFIYSTYQKYLEQGKIRYVRINNSGVCVARNTGLELARNEWIAYVDSDNTIVNNFLEIFSTAIKNNPEYKSFYGRWNNTTKNIKSPFVKYDYELLTKKNYIDLGVFIHHISIYKELGGFDTSLKRLVDWELILKYSKVYKPFAINKVIMNYNDDPGLTRISTSEAFSAARLEIWKRYNNYKVTTIIVSYNHAQYISQAIESAIMQEGCFEHEILIADDASTDNTPQIINEYVKKYPHLIKNISSTKNLGISENYRRSFTYATGKYIAILEGDDFWLTSDKLQKQTTLLELDPNAAMAFSAVKLYKNDTNTFVGKSNPDLTKNIITSQDILNDPRLNPIVNFSCCVFRKEKLLNLPEGIYSYRLSEISLGFYFTKKEHLAYIVQPLSAYRIHSTGVWSSLSSEEKNLSGYLCRKTALRYSNIVAKCKIYRYIKKNYLKDLYKKSVINKSEIYKLRLYMLGFNLLYPICLSAELIYKTTLSLKNYGWEITRIKIRNRLLDHFLGEYLQSKNVIQKKYKPQLQDVQTAQTNANLLMNPDFKVNSRGRNIYKKGNANDRWRILNGVIRIKSNGIALISDEKIIDDKTCILKQMIETPSLYSNKELALSCSVKSQIGKWYMRFQGATKKELNPGLNSIVARSNNDLKSVVIYSEEYPAQIELEWVKLELGRIATPFIQPDHMIETLRCLHYNYCIKKGTIRRMEFMTEFGPVFCFSLPCELRSIPKLRYDQSCFYVKGSDNEALDGKLSVYQISNNDVYLLLTLNGENNGKLFDYTLIVTKTITLDAEIY